MEIAATAFALAVSLALAFILLRCCRTLWVDEARHHLFSARDALFLYAVDNNLTEHPAYKSLREFANINIRYTHVVSFPRIAILIGLDQIFPQGEPENLALYQKSLRSLPDSHRAKFEEFHAHIAMALFMHLARSSLFLRACYVLALPLLWIFGNTSRPTPTPRAMGVMERDAYAKCA